MKKIVNLKTKLFYSKLLGLMYASIPKVYAETDPLNAINNLSNFIFDMLTGVGTMILAFGAILGNFYQVLKTKKTITVS